jgi:diguanylate cyclase (GGDEF)-like protein/putative nucleotidyltransferase with HDIG domain
MSARRRRVSLLRARLVAATSVAAEERALAGRVNGVLYAVGGLTLWLSAVIPAVTDVNWPVLLVVSGAAIVWGLFCVAAIRWQRAPSGLIHVSTMAAFGVIGTAIASSGGAGSPAWIYLFFVGVFASYFYRPVVACAYLAGCVLTHAMALLLDPGAAQGASLAQFVIASPAYFVLGGAIITGRQQMWQVRLEVERLAAEQGALRRVATAVVSGDSPEKLYALVAYEAARLLGAGAAGILRLETPTEAIVMGSWSDHEGGRYKQGTRVPVRPGGDVARALATRRPARIDSHLPDSPVRRLGYSSSIVAPVQVAGTIWGVLAVTAAEPGMLTTADEQQLTAFGDLLATAITSIEDRTKLAAQASTDPLTGLANHRTLHERLAAEVARAVRHQRPLSVAVLDIDHFKQINDLGGHDAGDETLARVARCLNSLARVEDTLGRIGGDEFAWLLPECTREQALVAVERARQLIAETVPETIPMTVSAGICDTSETGDAAELISLADGALYWSKAHGRNQCWVYDRGVISELSAGERAERLERSRALVGLRALARAIDAKDPATSEHSERVADLAGKLARASGWAPERALLLSQAALVHDVGKIGVPDALLRKIGPLSDAEYDQIKTHAELSARIVEDVLLPEQVEWIRSHHERPDGNGYPRGLAAHVVPEGSSLLAAADAWDVMTVSRPYSIPKSPRSALAECIELTGIQFTATAVAALKALHDIGDLHIEGAEQNLDAQLNTT